MKNKQTINTGMVKQAISHETKEVVAAASLIGSFSFGEEGFEFDSTRVTGNCALAVPAWFRMLYEAPANRLTWMKGIVSSFLSNITIEGTFLFHVEVSRNGLRKMLRKSKALEKYSFPIDRSLNIWASDSYFKAKKVFPRPKFTLYTNKGILLVIKNGEKV